MIIEHVDRLRCVQSHEEAGLVLVAEEIVGRDVVEGVLGCPVCHAEYPIHRSVAYLASPALVDAPQQLPLKEAEALLGLLALVDPRQFLVLQGAWCRVAGLLHAVLPVQLLLLNPARAILDPARAAVSNLVSGPTIPLVESAADAIALDGSAGGNATASALRALRGGGRLCAPASLALPAGFVEVARADDVRVVTREAAAAPVQISRR